MNRIELFQQIVKKKSFLCVGLDTDINKIPRFLHDFEYPVFEFNKRIIDATANYAVAFKPNLAFYETLGAAGWINLEMTVNYIREKYPDLFLIADAKRGDIGNTSKMYAKAFLKDLNFDAVTVAPYMGKDSIAPFLEFSNKWVIILALTSNPGSADFQFIRDTESGEQLFEQVIRKSSNWGTTDNIMYVVGATQADMLVEVRKIIPDHFLLIPDMDTHGGNLAELARYGLNNQCGLLVNSSRDIIYADATDQFAGIAGNKANVLQQEMEQILIAKGLLHSPAI
jgi:orotidine-5'-phosphate decarboxylase